MAGVNVQACLVYSAVLEKSPNNIALPVFHQC